jgi:hypothetical protein
MRTQPLDEDRKQPDPDEEEQSDHQQSDTYSPASLSTLTTELDVEVKELTSTAWNEEEEKFDKSTRDVLEEKFCSVTEENEREPPELAENKGDVRASCQPSQLTPSTDKVTPSPTCTSAPPRTSTEEPEVEFKSTVDV